MQSVVETILQNGEKKADKAALLYRGQTVTYGELVQRIEQFACTLKQKKIPKGSRIMLEAGDLPSYFCAMLGCQLYGSIAVPFEKNISIYKMQMMLAAVKPKLIFMQQGGEVYADYFQPLPDGARRFSMPKPEAVCVIVATSGTTGTPSLVAHTNRSMAAEAANLAEGTNIEEDTVLFCNIPFELAAGYRRVTASLSAGASVCLSGEPLSWETLMRDISAHGINHLSLVSSDIPVLVSHALAEKSGGDRKEETAPDGIRYVESAAGELPHGVISNFYRCFPKAVLYNVYGTSEAGCILIHDTRDRQEERCLGREARHAVITLLDENGEPVTQPGKYGHVAVSGAMNMQGYYKKKDMTEKVMSDGRLVLRDIAYFDEDGLYYFVSRVGDIINVKGHKVPPAHIETAALESGKIKDCACVAKEDALAGQLPVLYVECGQTEAVDTDGLMAYLREKLEDYCVPDEIIKVPKIPRTATGKLMRRSLPFVR